jgi:cryptochrome
MAGNPICRQIPWGTGAQQDEHFEAWKEGRTGYPWIDACMIQLKQEGHIHHLARHAVACFLTRGDLWVSWERGVEWFDEVLLDADWALNNGNWMWLSASCFFYQYFRVYSPVAFPKKYDPDGAFVKRYIPALRKMPAKYIYEPWKAPIATQKEAGCRIGEDYPKPIVIHEVVSKENMAKMKAAYDANKDAAGAGDGDGDDGDEPAASEGKGAAKGAKRSAPAAKAEAGSKAAAVKKPKKA